jgi:hypothetical protein
LRDLIFAMERRMGRPAHGRATATASVRRVIQGGSDGLRMLSERHGIIPKAALEWKKRIGAHGSGFDGFQPRIQGGDRRVARRVARNLLTDSGGQAINRAPDARAFAHVRAERSTQKELSVINYLRRHLVHGLD